MKHTEIYDKHTDQRKSSRSPKRRTSEGLEFDARRRRASFKNFIREIEDELLNDDLDTIDQDLDQES